MTWGEFADSLAIPQRAPIALAEYNAAEKAERDKHKDTRGYVGAILADGARRKDAVKARTLVTLDIDSGDQNTLETMLAELEGEAYVIYSTMSHTATKPRYRLVQPLSRHCTPDEYEAVTRYIAGNIDIEAFDDTTYQAERLMYYPNVCQDADYLYIRGEGQPVDVDAILDKYNVWQDVSEWPRSKRIERIITRNNTALGDPRTKPHTVGAFCRAYGIARAITLYLSDVYKHEPQPYAHATERYTYLRGSSVCGVVVYDDQLAYSHHATDPAGGQSLNAYDLVRVHRYGHLDAGCDPHTRIDRRPSVKAMDEWCITLPEVRAQIVRGIAGNFDGIADDAPAPTPQHPGSSTKAHDTQQQQQPAAPGDDWRAALDITLKGGIANTAHNVATILRCDPDLAGRVYHDDFSGRNLITEDMPWRNVDKRAEWSDVDDSGLRLYLEKTYGITGGQRVLDGLAVVLEERRRNPVQEYIETAKWDKVKRVDTLFVDYLGAPDTPLIRAITRKSIVACVARAYTPGCKFDQITVLSGREGIGKSTILRKLGGEWYNDSFVTVDGKEAMEQLSGAWLIEIAELAGLKKAEVAAVKAFVSKQEDTFRAAYARRVAVRPRKCVFFATTNEDSFLRDEGGNRRFWITPVGVLPARRKPWDMTPEEVAQIWAEARAIYDAGEELHLPPEYSGMLHDMHEQFAELDVRTGVIANYLDKPLPYEFYGWTPARRRAFIQEIDGAHGYPGTTPITRERISVAEVLYECFPSPIEPSLRMSREINKILSRIPGWERTEELVRDGGYGRQRVFIRSKSEE